MQNRGKKALENPKILDSKCCCSRNHSVSLLETPLFDLKTPGFATGCKPIALVCALLLGAATAYPCEKSPVKDEPYCNRTLPAEERARLLVDRMTVGEVVPQLLTQAIAIDKLGVEAYNYWSEVRVTMCTSGKWLGSSFFQYFVHAVCTRSRFVCRLLWVHQSPF
jgi:hypothetical protein